MSVLLSVSLSLLPPSAAALAASRTSGADLLVRSAPGADLDGALRRHGLRAEGSADRSGWIRVRGDGASADRVEQIRLDAAVAAAEPNFPVVASASIDDVAGTWTPSDPRLGRQWNLTGMPRAWYATRGTPGVTVAVLDTGFSAALEAPVALRPGADFIENDGNPADDNGHGTHIASIIAQATDNAFGAAGIAPEVALLPVKVLDASGKGSVATVASGIYFATDAGARVINLSLAMSPAITWSAPLHDAVAYAASRGVVLVGAAGNDGAGRVALPAAFNAVIAVGALHSAGSRPGYSNGGDALDLVAPGGDDVDRDHDGHPDGIIAWSLDPEAGGQGLYLGAGTSQAAAHVSGAAALLLAAGESDRDRIRSLLELTAAPVGAPGWSATTGHGALDLAGALVARATLATRPSSTLGGWVHGQNGAGGNGLELANAVGLVLRLEAAMLLVLEDKDGIWAFTDSAPDRVAIHRLRGSSLVSLVRARDGLRAIRDGSSSIDALLAKKGSLLGLVDAAGGVSGLLDASSTELPGDTLLALIDVAGGMREIMDASGGVTGLLDGSGSFLALVEGSGGMLGVLDGAGGIAGMLGDAGGVTGWLDSSSRSSPLGSANGLLPAEI